MLPCVVEERGTDLASLEDLGQVTVREKLGMDGVERRYDRALS